MSALYRTPELMVAAAIMVLVLGALETGYRLGRRLPASGEKTSWMSTAILTLVGLLLAFSFSLAASRFETRRQALVDEANAIGTFWLRTELLPATVRDEMRPLVRNYVELHFEHRAAGIDVLREERIEEEVDRIQGELWSLLMEESKRQPETRDLLLVTPALNSMFDATSTMLAAKENRLPDPLLYFLFSLVIVASLIVGYGHRAGERNPVLWGALIIVLGGVLTFLLDLDRPRRGFIRADPTPLIRLRDSLERDGRR